MRRASCLRLSAVACAAALSLAACGDDGSEPAAAPSSSTSATSPSESSSPSDPATSTTSSPAEPSPTSTGLVGLPTVTGDFGEKPKLTVPAGDPPAELQVKTLDQGSGVVVASGDTVVADYLGARWADGKPFDSSFKTGTPAGFVLAPESFIPGWVQGLTGQKVGSRVLLVIPSELAFGDTPPEGTPIQPGDTLVFVVDLRGAHDASDTAEGTITPIEDDSYPAVSILPKKPEINVPPGKPPRSLFARPVITGKGSKVEDGDVVVVQYSGVLWRNGEQFDSSWDSGHPFVAQLVSPGIIEGWIKGLVGQTVGSRVLLVIPPGLGYGDEGSGAIKPGDTLVFAIDVLGAY